MSVVAELAVEIFAWCNKQWLKKISGLGDISLLRPTSILPLASQIITISPAAISREVDHIAQKHEVNWVETAIKHLLPSLI